MKTKKITKPMLAMLLLLLIAGSCIGMTLAFLTADSGEVVNTMIPGEVTTTVVEKFSGDVKEDVQIKNTGNTDAYIRAAVIVTWQQAVEETGEITSYLIYGEAPTEEYYEISWSGIDNGTWIKGSDGFYYHKAPVKSDDQDAVNCFTSVLFTGCKPTKPCPDENYKLCVEIIASAIQANGVTDDGDPVVVEEWFNSVNNLELINNEIAVKQAQDE